MEIVTTVNKAFIEQRDANVIKYRSTPEKVDCEFLEFALVNYSHLFSGYTKDTDDWWYDAYHPEHGYCDFKCKAQKGPWYSVTRRSLEQPVDTYIAWEWIDKPNAILREGDTVKMKIIAHHPKDYVESRIQFKYYPDSGFVKL